jgi:zinc protease
LQALGSRFRGKDKFIFSFLRGCAAPRAKRRFGHAWAGLLFLPIPTCAHALDVKVLPSPKGEEVWYVSDHTLPMIALSAALPAGSVYDPAAKAGLANFAADLLDEGAGTLKSDAFQTALSNRAIRLSITPERDWLVISLVTLSDNAKDAFQLLGLALSRPRFDADAVARVRAQIISNIAEQDEDPESVADRAFFRAWFHEHAYAHPITGDRASVAAINAGDLKRFAASHWVSRGMKVAVSGDVNEDRLRALLKSAFGALPANAPPLPKFFGHPGQYGISVVPMPVPQPVAVFGLPGMLRGDPEYLPGYIANYILGGGGFSSRLTDEVREKRGLTYDISTSLESWRKAGFVLGEVATRRGSMKQTTAVIRDTLRDFAQTGPTEKELADAKTYLTGSFPLTFSSNVGIADQLNVFQRIGLGADYVQNRNAMIRAVTLDQVKHAAKRLFDPAHMTVVVAGSLGEAAPHQNPSTSGKGASH